MRLEAAIFGDLEKIVAEEMKKAETAVVAGLREAGEGLRDDLAVHTASADLGRLARTWRFRVFRGRGALSAAALVFPRGKSPRRALWAFEHGAVIRAVNRKFLAIPTQFNRQGGRRGGKVLYRPEELQETFVARSKAGHLLLFARVREAARRTGSGRVKRLAAVEGKILGSGRRKRTEAILDHGAVPMFILKSTVTIRKRIDVDSIVRGWRERLPEIIVRHWNEG